MGRKHKGISMGQMSGGLLRSRLLVGVATIAIAAPVADRAVAQEAKWQPWLEAGGMGGSDRSFGDVDMFVPVWQDPTSLLFADVRGRFSTDPSQEGNFGLGYRTQIDPEWILGGYGYFDLQNSENDNLFYQITLGAEAMSVDWDFRLNGYIPLNSSGYDVSSKAGLKISGNTIQMQAGEEKALYGFDGEVGWRIPIFPADGDVDVRAFVGGYYFNTSDVQTEAGPRGRLEVRLYDLDLLGVQSRLTLNGEVQWDEVRGTQGLGGLELRIPLGAVTGEAGPKLSPLDRRMVDRVRRDVDIVTQAGAFGNPEDVIVDGLTVKTHTIYFADANGGGNGSKGNPTDLASAVSGAPANSHAIIVVQGNAGAIGVDNPLQLQDGQALIGGKSTVKLTGADSGQTVDFHAPGKRPTLVGANPNQDLIQLTPDGQNRVTGLNLTGSFYNGIFGFNVERAIITGNTITGAVNDGVYLFQDGTGAHASSFVKIEKNTIVGNAGDGIDITNYVTNGTAITQSVIVDKNTASGNAGDGIILFNRAVFAGSSISQAAQVNNNTANFNGYAGIAAINHAQSGGTIDQQLLIDPNTVNYNGSIGTFAAGIFAFNIADTGGSITQAAAISDNVALGNTGAGIVIGNAALTGGTVSQTVSADGNTANGNAYAGIALFNTAISGGVVSQIASLTDDIANGNGVGASSIAGSGIFLGNFALSGGVVHQTAAINDATVEGNEAAGIALYNIGIAAGAQISQTVAISGAVAAGNSIGVQVLNAFDDDSSGAGAGLSQVVLVQDSTIVDNFAGIVAVGRLYDGNFTQAIGITGNTIVGNEFGGILIANQVLNNVSGGTASLSQAIGIDHNSIAYNGGFLFISGSSAATFSAAVIGGGVQVLLQAENEGSSGVANLSSTISVTYNTFRNNFAIGSVSSGSSVATVTIGADLIVTRTGLNEGNDGVVNVSGNVLTIANNSIINSNPDFLSEGLLPAVIINDNAINGTSSNGITGGVVNFVSNITTIQGNDFESVGVLVTQTGINAASSGGVVQLIGNALNIQGNEFNDTALIVGTTGVNEASSGGLVQLVSNSINITGNQFTDSTLFVASSGFNEGGSGGTVQLVSNSTRIQANFLTNSDIIVDSSVANFASSGLVRNDDNILAITGNSISGGSIADLNFVVNGTSGGTQSGGVAQMVSNSIDISDNTIASGGILVVNTGSNGAASNGTVAMVSNTFTIDANTLIHSYSGIIVVDAASQSNGTGGSVTLSDSFHITNNTIAGAYTSGGLSSLGTGIFFWSSIDNENPSGSAILADGVTIAGNNVSDVIAIGLAVNGSDNNATSGSVVMGNTLSIADNTVSGPVIVVNVVGNSAPNGSAQASNVVSITNNDITSGDLTSGGGNFVGLIVENTANNNASAGSAGMRSTMSIVGNTITGDRGFGAIVFEGAHNRGGGSATLSSSIDFSSNTVSGQTLGVLFGASADSGAITQTGVMSNNLITSNAAIGQSSGGINAIGAVNFLAGNTNAGTASQGFILTGNTISQNEGNGVFTFATGAGTTQDIALSSGNAVTSNGLFGLYLANAGGATVTFHTDGTNLTGNSSGPLHTTGTVNIPN
jgi:hypothetical protein